MARGLPEPLEREIQAAVCDHWRHLALPSTLVAAIPNQKAHGQPGLTPGLADLLVMGPNLPRGRVGFVELKRNMIDTRTPAQLKFAELCKALEIPYAVAFGREEPIEVLEDWRVVRKAGA